MERKDMRKIKIDIEIDIKLYITIEFESFKAEDVKHYMQCISHPP